MTSKITRTDETDVTQYGGLIHSQTQYGFRHKLGCVGVDHGGTGGTRPPIIWSGGGDNANCRPQILSYKYKNERSVAFRKRQNPFFWPGFCPGPRWGSSRRSPRPPSRLKRGHSSAYPTPLGTNPPSALAMRRPEFQPDLRLFVGVFNLNWLQ